MADRVYPSSKPTSNPPQSLNPPTTKSQLYGASRPFYRPTGKPRHRRRSPSCLCLILILLLSLIIVIAIATTAIWFFYRPHRPSFSVSALRISSFNLSSSSTSHLNSHLNLSLSAQNPNKKLVFIYDSISISVLSGGVTVADGSIPAFVQGVKDTTILKTAVSSNARELDSTSAASIRSDMKQKSGLPIEIRLDTKVGVKMGNMKVRKVGIMVFCDGINAVVPKGKSMSVADSSGAKCKVKSRIKIWKWHI